MRIIAGAIVLGVASVSAATPSLVPVDTGAAALKLSAPAGWEVRLEPPRRREMSMIATLSARCKADVSVMIQLDRTQSSAAALLKEQYPKATPKTQNGWSCVVDQGHVEAMCAGTLRGLGGIVTVYFASTDGKLFNALGGGELATAIARSLGWSGGAPESLAAWTREASAAASAGCKP